MYVICYSGGHSSALCAIEAVRKHGKENVILLNHDIHPDIEDVDIKRFKNEVADYLELPITYANHPQWDTMTPIDVCLKEKAWKIGKGRILCTSRLKTRPFDRWRESNDPDKLFTYIYGFDNSKSEVLRAQRRSQLMGLEGYKTEYPLISWERTIYSVEEVGIRKPMLYNRFKHANCSGCLKAGFQHWYIVYCERPDLWEKAKQAEEEIGYALFKIPSGPIYLEEKEELFSKMKKAGVEPTEHINRTAFWTSAKRAVKEYVPVCDIADLEEQDKGVCLECMV